MANNKLAIELGSKLAGDFGAAFQSATGQLSKLNHSLSNLRKQQLLVKRFDMQTADISMAKQRLDEANEAVRKLRVEVQNNPTKKLRDAFTRAHEKSEKLRFSLHTQRAQLAKTRKSMESAGLSTKNTSKTMDGLGEAIDRVSAKAKKLQGLKKQQADLAQGFGELKSKAIGAFASVASTAVIVKPAFDFQAAASELQAKSAGMADDQRSLLEVKARELGRTMRFTATEAMQGMTFLSMAGFDPKEIEQAAAGMLNLAQSAGMGLADTADIASNILSGFKLKATEMDRAADVLAHTFTTSNVTLYTLGETMKYVAPVATAAGQSIEQMAVMTGMLGDVGIQGSNAGTALRAALLRLADPPKAAAEALHDLGVKTMDADKNMRAMPEILGDIQKSTEGMGNGEILAKISKIFGVEAAAALTELVSSSENITEKYTNLIENAVGTTDRVAKTMGDNANGAINRMSSAFNDLAITLGSVFTPHVESAADNIAGMVGSVSVFLSENPRFTKALGLAATAIIAVTTAGVAVGATMLAFKASMLAFGPVIGGVTAAFTGLGAAIPIVVGGIKAVGVAMAANPIGLTVTAIAAGAAIIVSNWDSVGPFFGRLWGDIKSIASNASDWWTNLTFTEKVLDVSSLSVDAALYTATSFFDWWDTSALKQHSPSLVVVGVESAKQMTNAFFDWWDGTTFTEKVVSIHTSAVDAAHAVGTSFAHWWSNTTLAHKVLSVLSGPLRAARSVAESFLSWWDSSTMKAHTPTVITSTIDSARSTAGRFISWWNDASLKQKVSDVVYTTVSGAWDLSQGFSKWWDGWSLPTISASVDGSLLKEVWDLAKRFVHWWNNLDLKTLNLGDVKNAISGATSAVSDAVDLAGEKAGEMLDTAGSTISGFWGKAASSVSDTFSSLKEQSSKIGTDFSEGFAEGVKRSTAHIDAAKQAAQSVEDAARDTLDTHSPSKVMESVGMDAAAGAAIGLIKGTKGVARAASGMGKQAQTAFKKAMAEGKQLTKSLRTDQERYKDEVGHYKTLLDQGAVSQTTYNRAVVKARSEYESNNVELQRTGVLSKTINQGLTDSIMSAVETGKLSFSSLKDHLKETFNNLVLSPIIKSVMQPVSNLIGGAMGSVGQALSGGMGGSSGGIGQLLSGSGGSGGGLGGISQLFSAKGLGYKGMLNGGGGFMSAVGPAMMAGGLGYLAGDLLGAANPAAMGALSGIGMAVAGPIGALVGGIVGSLFGGKKEATGSGVQLAYSSQAGVDAQQFVDYKKKRSFWRGTKRWTEYSAMDSTAKSAIDDYFVGMNDSITASVEAMGVKNADNILGSFSVAAVKLSGDDIEGQIENWLTETSGKAYQAAFKGLPYAIKRAIDPVYSSLRGTQMGDEALAERFKYVGAVAQTVQPALESMGVGLTETVRKLRFNWGSFRVERVERDIAGSATKNATLLTDALGGLEPALAKLDFAYKNLTPETKRFSDTFINQRNEVVDFNKEIGRTGANSISSKEGLWEYIQGLDATTKKGREAAAAAFNVAGAMTTFADTIAGIEGMFGSTISAIADDLMTPAEKLQRDMDAAKGLFDELKSATDPGKIADISSELNSAVNAAWSGMSDAEKASMGDYYTDMLSGASDLATERLKGNMSDADLMSRAISTLNQPAATFSTAADTLGGAASELAGAVSLLPSYLQVKTNGSHASGLRSVPFDGYVAELHQHEAVIPAQAATLLRSGAPVMMDAQTRMMPVLPERLSSAANDSSDAINLPANVMPIQQRADAVLNRTINRSSSTQVTVEGDSITIKVIAQPGQSPEEIVDMIERRLDERDKDKARRYEAYQVDMG